MIPIIRFINLIKACDKKGGEVALQKLKLQESMTYENYIHGMVWNIISDFCKIVQPECVKCGATYNLRTHHLSYEHMTMEMYHLDTLTVLCDMHHTLLHTVEIGARKNKQLLPEEWTNLPNIQSLMETKGLNLYEMV